MGSDMSIDIELT